MWFTLLYAVCAFSQHLAQGSQEAKKPNIIVVLTDDQDKLLYGMDAMPKTKKLIGEAGATAENFFVATPSCCVSRATILTGMYAHNTKTMYNTLKGGCNGDYWRSSLEPDAVAVSIQNAGYKTFFMGKYLNQYGNEESGGAKQVPAGWNSWLGLTSENRYYDYTLSIDGVATNFGSTEADYFTTQMKNYAKDFLTKNHEDPFFMFLAATAPHGPSTPEKSKENLYKNKTAPHDGAYDHHSDDKHWLIRQAPKTMPQGMVHYIDTHYVYRWQTLSSVDDLVELVINELDGYGVLDNTYIIFTSDNGFHLGQFCMPVGKWQPYEWDIKVPFLIRGPGIASNSIMEKPILTVDITPTLLSLSGAKTSLTVDGKDFSPLFVSPTNTSGWRKDFLIEYWGTGGAAPVDCPQHGDHNVHACRPGCVCQDARNNTFACVRTLNTEENSVYCEFDDTEQYKEFYKMDSDKYQLTNLAVTSQFTEADQNSHAARLAALKACAGVKQCF